MSAGSATANLMRLRDYIRRSHSVGAAHAHELARSDLIPQSTRVTSPLIRVSSVFSFGWALAARSGRILFFSNLGRDANRRSIGSDYFPAVLTYIHFLRLFLSPSGSRSPNGVVFEVSPRFWGGRS